MIDLDAGTVAVLRDHTARQAEERGRAGDAWAETGHVFTAEDGQPLHPDLTRRAFEARRQQACLPRIRLHDVRHTHATLLLQAGVPVKVVSERLGHANVAFTMTVYQHVLPGMQREGVDRLAAVLQGGASAKT